LRKLCVSVSAKLLNKKFEDIISSFQYDKKHEKRLKEILSEKLKARFASDELDRKNMLKRVAEIKGQLDKVEERFVLGEITREQHIKYVSIYEKQIVKIQQEGEQYGKMSSNLEKAVEKGLLHAQDLYQTWVLSDYYGKRKLQYLVFPDGMMYDKKTDNVLTNRINALFSEIALQASVCDKSKKDNLLKNCLFGSNVDLATIDSNLLYKDLSEVLEYADYS
jgi:hypothetical protein